MTINKNQFRLAIGGLAVIATIPFFMCTHEQASLACATNACRTSKRLWTGHATVRTLGRAEDSPVGFSGSTLCRRSAGKSRWLQGRDDPDAHVPGRLRIPSRLPRPWGCFVALSEWRTGKGALPWAEPIPRLLDAQGSAPRLEGHRVAGVLEVLRAPGHACSLRGGFPTHPLPKNLPSVTPP